MKRNQHAGRLKNGGLRLEVFTQDEIEDLHLGSLEVLSETGVFVPAKDAQEIFAEGGATVNPKTGQTKIPAWLVEEALFKAPAKFIAHGRTPKDDVVMESNRVYFTNFAEGISIQDLETGQIRETVLSDVANLTRVINALDTIEITLRAVNAHNVPQKLNQLYNFEAVIKNTTKPISMGPGNLKQAEYILRIAEEVAGKENMPGRSQIGFGTCPISPLRLIEESTDLIIFTAKNRLPLEILSMAMSGGSAPANLAGTLVVHNAEVLSGLVLAQLVNPGNPIIYGSSTTAMNLKTATATVGSPELALVSAGVAALAQHYKLPCMVAGG
jgi:trimethylamine--corrinoid protein Co-methyltransferase